MANTKISALSALTGANVDPAADVFAIVDTSTTTTKKILAQEVFNAASTLTALTGANADASADSLPIYDNSATSEKKILVSQLGIALHTPQLGTEQASTSGTSIDFTSIPSGVKRITVIGVGVSTNGTAVLACQIGDSGGVETSGYAGVCYSSEGGIIATTTYFRLTIANTAAGVYQFKLTLTLENAATFTWALLGVTVRTDAATLAVSMGTKSLSAELDRIRITTANGTDAFDAGVINIVYE